MLYWSCSFSMDLWKKEFERVETYLRRVRIASICFKLSCNYILRVKCKTNTISILMHQMHISTKSALVLRTNKWEIRKKIVKTVEEPGNPPPPNNMPWNEMFWEYSCYLFVCVIVYCCQSTFSAIWWLTPLLVYFVLCLMITAFCSEGSFTCHICCDMRY
jgi:hypothetical protein